MDTTTSTASDGTSERPEIPIHIHVNILSESNLANLWKDLKKGMYSSLKSIKFSLTLGPGAEISKMKHLADVFGALAKLPHLQDVEFYNAALFVPSLIKLFKKSSSGSLKSLKFCHCKFILSTKSKRDASNLQKLWDGIRLQTDLTVLEFVSCSCSHYQLMGSDSSSEDANVSIRLPAFLQEQELSKLKRLVLDHFVVDSSTFDNVLSNNSSLEELEIHPIFETDATRRRQYQAKKAAIRQFLLETVPASLTAANNQTLKKLIISIDDYHLDSVYADAMAEWIELVRDDNHTLIDLRATKDSLGSYTKEGDNVYGLERNEWLHCNLQYYLRLNQLVAEGHVSPQDMKKEDVLK